MSMLHSPLVEDHQTLLLVTGGYPSCNTWLLSVGGGALWREVSSVNESVMVSSDYKAWLV